MAAKKKRFNVGGVMHLDFDIIVEAESAEDAMRVVREDTELSEVIDGADAPYFTDLGVIPVKRAKGAKQP